MKIVVRMVIFGTIFSIMFFWIRHIDLIPMRSLLAETNGIGLLYSTIGLVFGVISAFVIQTQWDNWDKLSVSVHGEIKSLKQLLLFSKHLKPKMNEVIKVHIKNYTQQIITDWYVDD